jgi:membrane protease subunit HflC
MIELIRRRPMIAIGAIVLALFLLLSAFPIVPETKQAVVVRFGKPVRILNRYEPGRPIGTQGAVISWRLPIAEQVVWIDKRVLDVDMQRQQVLSTDQRRLELDAFARYRIVDPLLMYIRKGSVTR